MRLLLALGLVICGGCSACAADPSDGDPAQPAPHAAPNPVGARGRMPLLRKNMPFLRFVGDGGPDEPAGDAATDGAAL